MTPDGIDTTDWDQVHELALEVVNTSTEGDEAASTAASDRLRLLLDQLQEKYGPLPSLLATRADYVDLPEDREYWLLAAYSQAERRDDGKNKALVAESLASFYIEECLNREQGARWLERLVEHLRASGEPTAEAERLRTILEGRQ